MRIAYFDCIGGLAGDMALAALLDAGADPAALVAGLKTLPLPPWELRVMPAARGHIAARRVAVEVSGMAADSAPLLSLPPPDAPLPAAGHTHEHAPGHHHTHTHDHAQEASVESGPLMPAGHHETRTLGQVLGIIEGSALPGKVREAAAGVFRRLAEAEAYVHGATPETVHFHEVGAVDSIVDVVGVVYALHLLGVERVACSPLPTGHGFIRCAHGQMPNPAPATAELLKGLPLRSVDVEAELVTPTGAALAAGLAAEFGPAPSLILRAVGYGAGRRDFSFPNLVRVLIGESCEASIEATSVTLIEANIDDQSPQLLAAAADALLSAGALDVWLTPIVMKKGRAAHTLSALAPPERREALTRMLFAHTSTIGVRYGPWHRVCLPRAWRTVETPYGAVRVKVARLDGRVVNAAPEFEECRRAAEASGVPVKVVHAAALAALNLEATDE